MPEQPANSSITATSPTARTRFDGRRVPSASSLLVMVSALDMKHRERINHQSRCALFRTVTGCWLLSTTKNTKIHLQRSLHVSSSEWLLVPCSEGAFPADPRTDSLLARWPRSVPAAKRPHGAQQRSSPLSAVATASLRWCRCRLPTRHPIDTHSLINNVLDPIIELFQR